MGKSKKIKTEVVEQPIFNALSDLDTTTSSSVAAALRKLDSIGSSSQSSQQNKDTNAKKDGSTNFGVLADENNLVDFLEQLKKFEKTNEKLKIKDLDFNSINVAGCTGQQLRHYYENLIKYCKRYVVLPISLEIKWLEDTRDEIFRKIEKNLRKKLNNQQILDGKPKKPPPIYFAYFRTRQNHYRKKYPQMSQPEMSQKIAAKWNKLPAENKEKYKRMYQEEMKEYEKGLEIYYQNHPKDRPPEKSNDEKNVRKRHAKLTKKRKPKKIMCGLDVFIDENLPKFLAQGMKPNTNLLKQTAAKEFYALGEQKIAEYDHKAICLTQEFLTKNSQRSQKSQSKKSINDRKIDESTDEIDDERGEKKKSRSEKLINNRKIDESTEKVNGEHGGKSKSMKKRKISKASESSSD